MTLKKEDFESPQEALKHFGVKGMKWGVRNAASKTKSGLKSAGAAIKEDDRQIMEARAAMPAKKAAYKTAKAQYKTDRKVVGRREARKALKPIRKDYYKNFHRAMDKTTSEVLTDSINDHYNQKWLSDFRSGQRRDLNQMMGDEAARRLLNTTVRSVLDD